MIPLKSTTAVTRVALFKDREIESEATLADRHSGAWWSKQWKEAPFACQRRAATQGKIWKERYSVADTTLSSPRGRVGKPITVDEHDRERQYEH